MKKSLHPDVRKFKAFVKNHPYVLRDVKNGKKTLQDLFEEYMLFGEDDDIWETYKNDEENIKVNAAREEEKEKDEEKESVRLKDFLDIVKKMNMNDLQKNLAQISGVLASVQELLQQFKQNEPMNTQETDSSPFAYRDD